MEQREYDDKYVYQEIKYLIDTETGKRVPRNRMRPKMETRDLKRMKIEEIQNNELKGGFFHLITEFGTNLIERFNVSFEDLGKLAVLFTYTNYREHSGGKMYLKHHNNVHYVDNKKLREVLKLKPEQLKQFKKRVKAKGILNEDKEGLFFEDDVIIRGHIFPVERKMNYIRVYDEPIRKLYDLIVTEGKSKTSKGVGVLLCLLPFMHQNKNILISSMWDKEEQRYRPMSNSKVAEALGMDRTVLGRNIKTMNNQLIKKIGEPLIYDVTVKPFGINDERYKKSGLVINPRYSHNSTSSDYKELMQEIEDLVITLPDLKM